MLRVEEVRAGQLCDLGLNNRICEANASLFRSEMQGPQPQPLAALRPWACNVRLQQMLCCTESSGEISGSHMIVTTVFLQSIYHSICIGRNRTASLLHCCIGFM